MNTSEVRSMIQLSTSASWALARGSVVGRLAVVVEGRPDIFPINHVVDHGSIVFRTAEGTKLASAVGQPVAFEVDGYDLDTATAWSVVVRGTAQEIRKLDEVLEALSLPVFPWHDVPKPRFLRIEADSISGRRFPVTGGSHGTHRADSDSDSDCLRDSS